MSPRSFVSPRQKYRGDPRLRTGFRNGQAIERAGGERTMIRLLAAVLSPKNPYFHWMQIDWRIQTLVLPDRKYFTVLVPAQLLLPMPPPKHLPFVEGPAPEEGTPRVSRELAGARAPRTRGEKGADSAPPPEEHPSDEPAEFRLPSP